jgi:hypothetical protein
MLSAEDQRPDYAAAARFIVAQGGRYDPIVVVPAPTPGPLSAMDAALAHNGGPGRPLLRNASPPLNAILTSPPYAFLPTTPPAVLARQALAPGTPDKIFVVAPGAAPAAALAAGRPIDPRQALGPYFGTGINGRLLATVYPPVSGFMRALGQGWRVSATQTFPGVLPVSVYVLTHR